MKRCFLLLVLLAVPAWGQIPAQANIYRARLTREARAIWGLEAPVALFAAQVHQESGWREDARSPVGALGLAQFMPGTAAWIAQLYPADLGEAAPFDARWALRALVTYDRWLWERLTEFREEGLHRWGATLSAYNGGLGNVRKDRQLVQNEGQIYYCDPAVSRWFCCVEHRSNRNPAAFRENRNYPRRILLTLWNRYQQAGW
jgi:soluble lytic murein transglycosylase-like protein